MADVRPLSPKVVPVTDVICPKFEHPAPEQRSTRYAVTATLSVAGPQLRLIWELEVGVAVRVPGALGGVASPLRVTLTAVFE
jgi:hypothetical protein